MSRIRENIGSPLGKAFLLTSLVVAPAVLCCELTQAAEQLAKMPLARVSLEREWRDALEIPAGSVLIDLGRVERGDVLRLGVLPAGQGGARVEVLVGGATVAEVKADSPDCWNDRRISLKSSWLGGRECVVKCDSANGVRLGPCEIVNSRGSIPNVLIVLLDTMRRDHLGCYGYPEKTSPFMDKLAKDGVLFHRLMSQSSWTRPSVASLLTSTYPPVHGAEDRYDAARPGLPELADALNRQGFASLGVVTNPSCLPVWGIGNTFTRYLSCCDITATKQSGDKAAVNAAMEGVTSMAGRPWFIYLHLMASHRPYSAPSAYQERFRPDRFVGTRTQRRIQEDLVLYDGEIACADEQVGRLMEFLKGVGCYDNTLIVLLSDHGEQFFEHGEQGHGVSLYDEELRVPLIIKLPGGSLAGETRQALVETVDVAPTILALLGLQPEPRFQGRSFAGILYQDRWENRAGYARLRLDGKQLQTASSRLAKYLLNQVTGDEYWFGHEVDFEEVRPATTPISDAVHFDRVIARLSIAGLPGLHIVVGPGSDFGGMIRIRVNAEIAGNFEFDCPPTAGQAMAITHGIEAEVNLEKLRDSSEGLGLVRSGWTAQAHLVLPVAQHDAVSISVEHDGATLSGKHIHMGSERRSLCLEGGELDLSALECDPLQAPCPDEADLSVCIWTLSSHSPVAPATLSEEIVEALRALGYLK